MIVSSVAAFLALQAAPSSSVTVEAKLYSGTGSAQTITLSEILTNVDYIWLFNRTTGAEHGVYSSLRGGGQHLALNLANAQYDYLSIGAPQNFSTSSFDISGTATSWNSNTDNFVAFCLSLTTSTPSNTNGSITSSTKNNDYCGLANYTGSGSADTVGHGNPNTPECIITKAIGDVSGYTGDYIIQHKDMAGDIFTNGGKRMKINSTLSLTNETQNCYTSTAVSSTTVTLPIGYTSGTNDLSMNTSGEHYEMLSFSTVAAQCKVGVYTGTGASLAVDCGFTNGTKAIFIVRVDADSSRRYVDSSRGGTKIMYLNAATVEGTEGGLDLTTSSGFTVIDTTADLNASGGTYAFVALAA